MSDDSNKIKCDYCNRYLNRESFPTPVNFPPACNECIAIDTALLKEKNRRTDYLFLSEKHKERFHNYCYKANVHPQDKERKAFFFIMAGNDDLISKGINNFYDFEENVVKFQPESLEDDCSKFDFCSSSRALTQLALNLYNSSYPSLSVSDTFSQLEKDNYLLALESIRIRFEP